MSYILILSPVIGAFGAAFIALLIKDWQKLLFISVALLLLVCGLKRNRSCREFLRSIQHKEIT